jgi:protease I
LPAKGGAIEGMKHHDKAGPVNVDLELKNARASDFDAALRPGGGLTPMRVEKAAQDFLRDIDRSRRPIAVICHGPWLFVSAGLV